MEPFNRNSIESLYSLAHSRDRIILTLGMIKLLNFKSSHLSVYRVLQGRVIGQKLTTPSHQMMMKNFSATLRQTLRITTRHRVQALSAMRHSVKGQPAPPSIYARVSTSTVRSSLVLVEPGSCSRRKSLHFRRLSVMQAAQLLLVDRMTSPARLMALEACL